MQNAALAMQARLLADQLIICPRPNFLGCSPATRVY